MKSIQEILEAALCAIEPLGTSFDEQYQHLQNEKKQLLEPGYRVAFLGQFKTGKSTLINRLILKDCILFTDILEATSIPTEVAYAPTPRLEVYRYIRKSFSVPLENDALDQSYVSDIVLARTVKNPSPEDVQAAVSADTPEGRTALANAYSHAILFWPADNLRQFTVIDTPGVNSTTEAVVTTTNRILPTCDAAVYVASLRQLDSADLSFLRNHIFESGLTRTLVLLNYDPDSSEPGPLQLEKIRSSVQAQLSQIGRNVPVHVAAVPRRGGLSTGSLGNAVTSSKTTWKDWREGESTQAEVCEGLAIEHTLIDFFRDNVRPGREEKVGLRTRKTLEKTVAKCELTLSLLAQADEELAQKISAQIDTMLREQNRKRDQLKHDLLADIQLLLLSEKNELRKQLNQTKDRLLTELDQCKDFEETQDWLKRQQQTLPGKLQEVTMNAKVNLNRKIRDLETRFTTRLRGIEEDLDHSQTSIDGGILEKIPPMLITSLDYLVVLIAGPFGIVGDLITRLVISKIPYIQNFLPEKLVKAYFKGYLKSSLNAQFDALSAELDSKLADAPEKTLEAVNAEWDKQTQIIMEDIEKTIAGSAQAADPVRIESLRNAVKSINTLLPKLPALSPAS
jgi:hypothetical protein